jgi:hypothetical protein
LDAIKLELTGIPAEVYPEPELMPDALKSLLGHYQPAAFHLAAHGTSESLQLQLILGPTLEELDITAKVVGAELGNSDVVVGVFNCRDSATIPYYSGPPGEYHISARRADHRWECEGSSIHTSPLFSHKPSTHASLQEVLPSKPATKA